MLQALTFLLLVMMAVPALAASRPPNIILILADDLGLGDLSVTGSRHIRTPNADRMAHEGAMLQNFYASASVCTPSRAGLLTGRYPARTGLAAGVLYSHSTYGLPQTETTIATVLKGAGYRTAMLGKWHLGSTAETWPTAHGFDRFWGVPWSNDIKPLPLFRDKTILEQPLVQESFARRLVTEARAVIEEQSDKPFFLYVAHIAPHIPLSPGPEFRGKSKGGLYGDFVEELDWTTGEILKAVKAAGKDRDTLIIFTSDNGPWFQGSAGNRRGRKGDSYEGGYAVPLIARWPGHIKPGTISDAIAMNIDLAPTFAALAGTRMPADRPIDGADILPVLQGSPKSPHDHLLFFLNEEVAAVRTQEWRLVTRAWYVNYNVPLAQLGGELLFRLTDDPGETIDRKAENPAVLGQLQAVATEAGKAFGAIPQKRTDPFKPGPTVLPQ